ncbi:MAG: NADH-quinone oxidoreductase subunit J [Phycisphaerae bacterium]|jgi:NADH-quinone oxidoreductase subunit J|nr:NADH-quinone oxidoreductase subunit J [Phycisphaerae bacterium]
MTPYALYAAGLIGAIGLYLLMRPSDTPGGTQTRILGTLIGLAGVAFMFVEVLSRASAYTLSDGSPLSTAFGGMPVPSVILGMAAIAAATRMVTHQKPVYAALYFILVVVSTAGLFLTLQAEFMAFALIIVYAGAILITYMFVLMLAHQSPSSPDIGSGWGGDVEGGTRYDRVPREPFVAVLIGFGVLASLSHAYFVDNAQLQVKPSDAAVATANADLWHSLETMPRRLKAEVKRVVPDMVGEPIAVDGQLIQVRDGKATVRVMVGDQPRDVTLPDTAQPTNTQEVGLALVSSFPASLELASVILLMAMFGAVVLARKQIEIGEDERRDAAGMRRLSVEDPEMVRDAARGGRS